MRKNSYRWFRRVFLILACSVVLEASISVAPAAESENYNSLTLTGSELVVCGGTSEKAISITVVLVLTPTPSPDVYLVSSTKVDQATGHCIGRTDKGETTCSWELTSASVVAQGGALTLARAERNGPAIGFQAPLVGLSLQWKGDGDCVPPSNFSIGPVSDGGSNDEKYFVFQVPLVHVDNLAKESAEDDISPWIKGGGTYDKTSSDCMVSRTYSWMLGSMEW